MRFGITIKGNYKTWSFITFGDKCSLKDWLADGLNVVEITAIFPVDARQMEDVEPYLYYAPEYYEDETGMTMPAQWCASELAENDMQRFICLN